MPVFNRFSSKRAPDEEDDGLGRLAQDTLRRQPVAQVAPGPAPVPTDQLRRNAINEAKGQIVHKRYEAANGGPQYDPDSNGQAGAQASTDGLDEFARTQVEHQNEREAAAAEMRATKQKALQQANARAGLGGMGLAGGTAALVSDIGRQQDRTNTLAMADLGRKQRDEDMKKVIQNAALDNLELEADKDYNNDGLVAGEKVGVNGVGNGDPEDNVAPVGSGDPRNQQDRETQAARGKSGGTGAPDDPYGGIGGYGDSSQQVLDSLKAGGTTFSYVRTEGGIANGEQYVIALGSDGKYYKFRVPGTGLFSKKSIDEIKQWFSAYGGGGQ